MRRRDLLAGALAFAAAAPEAEALASGSWPAPFPARVLGGPFLQKGMRSGRFGN